MKDNVMKLTKTQLVKIIRETVRKKMKVVSEVSPPRGTMLSTRAPAAAALAHPNVAGAIENLKDAMMEALEEQVSRYALEEVDQILHTEFHKELYDLVEEWLNTLVENAEGV